MLVLQDVPSFVIDCDSEGSVVGMKMAGAKS